MIAITHLTMYSSTTTLTQHPTKTPKMASTTLRFMLMALDAGSSILYRKFSCHWPRQDSMKLAENESKTSEMHKKLGYLMTLIQEEHNIFKIALNAVQLQICFSWNFLENM